MIVELYGGHNTGKTYLLQKLLEEFNERGIDYLFLDTTCMEGKKSLCSRLDVSCLDLSLFVEENIKEKKPYISEAYIKNLLIISKVAKKQDLLVLADEIFEPEIILKQEDFLELSNAFHKLVYTTNEYRNPQVYSVELTNFDRTKELESEIVSEIVSRY